MQSTDLIGSVLHDSHRIVRLIGEGGMGAVYEAVHVKLFKKRFAVKVLHARMAEDDTIYARFQREAMITSELGHPHIVEVLDFYETDLGQPCMVMEYLEGEDLGQRLEQAGRMSPEQVMALTDQVGSALQAVHDKGIIHRDMKPGNILLVGERADPIQAKVLDFGISKIQDANTQLTSDNAVMGTPHYMSPEQGEGHVKEVDHRTDIFALGTICYHALSGVLPFSAPSMLGVLRAICDKPHDPIKVHLPELGEDVDRVLNRALAKRKQDRYDRVEDFVRDLGLALAGKEVPLDAGALQVDGHTPEEVSRKTVAATNVPGFGEARPEPSAIPVTMVTPGGPGTDPDLMGLEEVHQQPAGAQANVRTPAVSADTTLSGSAAETARPAKPPPRGRPLWQVAAAVAVGVLLPLGVFVGIQKAGKEQSTSSAGEQDHQVAAAPSPGRTVRPGQPSLPKRKTMATPKKAAVSPASAPAPGRTNAPAVATAAPAPPAAPPEAGGSTAPPPGKKQSDAGEIKVKLDLRPGGATVMVDGVEHTENPLVLEASSRRRLLEFRAKGYRTKKLKKVLKKSQALRVRLRRKARGDRAPFDDLSDEPAKKKPAKDKAPFNDL